jgi:AcrR family transcriptional regulator
MTESAKRRLRADAARNRQALLDAAERLFARRGLAVSLDDIAAEAGVNVATAYRHFANKHELAEAFLRQSVERTVAIAEQAAALPDAAQGLAFFLDKALELMGGNRGLIDVLTHAYGADWFEELRAHVDPLLSEMLRRAQEAGAVRGELAPADFGVLLPMLGSIAGPDPQTALRLRRRYLGLLLAGMRPSDQPLPGPAATDAEIRPGAAVHRPGAAVDRPGGEG